MLYNIGKTASKKIEALISSMKFFSAESALYLYKSTIVPWMEHCCHVLAEAPNCYLATGTGLFKCWCFTCCLSWALGSSSICSKFFFGNFFVATTMVDVQQNWLSWFNCVILFACSLAILISCVILLSVFLDARRRSLSTVSVLAQIDFEFPT